MKITKYLRTGALLAALAFSGGNARATIIEYVTLNFESGGTWAGTITFNDGYEGMIDTSGTLTGGIHSYAVETTWTYWEGIGFTNPFDSNFDGFYDDYLAGGPEGELFPLIYIGLSWDAGLSAVVGGIIFEPVNDPYFNGWGEFDDLIVGYQIGPVPDGGATAALLGMGMFGVVWVKRRWSV